MSSTFHFLTTMPHVPLFLMSTWLNLCPSILLIVVNLINVPHQSLFTLFHNTHQTHTASNMAGTVSTSWLSTNHGRINEQMHGVIYQTQMLHALKPTTVSFVPQQQQPTFFSLFVSLIEHSSISLKVKPITRMKTQHRLRNMKIGCFTAVWIIVMPMILTYSMIPLTGVSQQELFPLRPSRSAQHGARQSAKKLTMTSLAMASSTILCRHQHP